MKGSTERTRTAKAVFESFGLKGKLKTVSTDLTTGWKSLSAKAKQEAKTLNKKARKALATYEEGSSVRYDQIYDCDFDTGFSLWKRFQQSWTAIHEDTDGNVGIAEVVDGMINELYNDWKKWEITVNQFHENLVAMPDIIAQVEIAHTQIDAIGNQMSKIEQLLLEYEDATEKVELERKKCGEKLELSKLVEKRQKTFHEMKAKYEMTDEESGEMARNLERQESIEKQQVYEDAFMEQMEQYIRYGELERPIVGSVGNETGTTDLSFDESDLDALKEFLGPEELDTVMKSQAIFSASQDNENKTKSTDQENEIQKFESSSLEDRDGLQLTIEKKEEQPEEQSDCQLEVSTERQQQENSESMKDQQYSGTDSEVVVPQNAESFMKETEQQSQQHEEQQ